jgi:hypothetical protein
MVYPKMAVTENQKPMYFFIHFLENGTFDDLPIRTYERPLHPIFAPDWDGFFRISLPDIVFSGAFAVNIFWFLCYITNIFTIWLIRQKAMKGAWKRWKNRKMSNANEERPFIVRKVTLSKDDSRETNLTVSRPRARSLNMTGHIQTKRHMQKRKAPRPPTIISTSVQVEKVENRMVPRPYKSPPKPRNPDYIIMRNANLPATDGYSDLDSD